MKWGIQSKERLENFLVELANLRVDYESVNRLLEKFPEFFPDPEELDSKHLAELKSLIGKKSMKMWDKQLGSVPRKEFLIWVLICSRDFQSVWDSPDLWTEVWRWVWLRAMVAKIHGVESDKNDPPPMSPFEASMLYFQQNIHSALHCGNPDCAAPYFFAKRKRQKYCSDSCAAYGQRQAKSRWWAEHGEEWREKRRVKKTSQAKAKKKGKGNAKKRENHEKRCVLPRQRQD